MRLRTLALTFVVSSSVACTDGGSSGSSLDVGDVLSGSGPLVDDGSSGPSDGTLAATLTANTGFWFQPDRIPPVHSGVDFIGPVRTHAVFYFGGDGIGRLNTILVQPNGTIPTNYHGRVQSYAWRADGDTLTLRYEFPVSGRTERFSARYDARAQLLAVVTDSPPPGSDGSGVWFPCAIAGCADRFAEI